MIEKYYNLIILYLIVTVIALAVVMFIISHSNRKDISKLKIQNGEQKNNYEKRLQSISKKYEYIPRNISETFVAETLKTVCEEIRNKGVFNIYATNAIFFPEYRGAISRTRQVDHVILSTKGILFIETKHWEGVVEIGFDTPVANAFSKHKLLQDYEKSLESIPIAHIKMQNDDKKDSIHCNYYKTQAFSQLRSASREFKKRIFEELDINLPVKNFLYFSSDSNNKIIVDHAVNEQLSKDNYTSLATTEKELKALIYRHLSFYREDVLTKEQIKQIAKLLLAGEQLDF